MTLEKRIVEMIRDKSEGYDDDCFSKLLEVRPRQKINQVCRRLETRGIIRRTQGFCASCGRQKILNFYASKPSEVVSSLQPNSPLPKEFLSSLPGNDQWRSQLEVLLKTKQETKALNKKIHEILTLAALDYLRRIHSNVIEWKTSPGAQIGPDILGLEDGIACVVAEIKGTDPYFGNRLGAAQSSSIKYDLQKLSQYGSAQKYFFVIGLQTVEAVKRAFSHMLKDIVIRDILSDEYYQV